MKTYNFLFTLMVILLLLTACGQAENPKSSYTSPFPSLTPSQMIEPFITSTSTITSTPITKGVILNYSIRVTDYENVSITLYISNITTPSIILFRLASPVMEAIPPIRNIEVVNENESSLEYSIDKWQGSADRHLEILNINTNNETEVAIRYTLNLENQSYWQVTPKYIAVTENQLFFQPDPDRLEVSAINFTFTVPDNWRVATRLSPEGVGFKANMEDLYWIVAYNNEWQRFYFGAPLAIGELDIIETRFEDIRILAAYPTGDEIHSNDASFVDDIFAYQENFLGSPSNGKGDIGYLYVFGPEIPPGNVDPIPAIVHGLYLLEHVSNNRYLGHEMFHQLYGCGNFLPEAVKFIATPCWFMEGANEFLSINAHLAVGAFTQEMANQWRVQLFQKYLEIRGTSFDLPISQCYDGLSAGSNEWYDCQYWKSYTLLFLLDQTISKYTEQNKNFTDVLAYLYKHSPELNSTYPLNWAGSFNEEYLLNVVSEVSGYDFTPFFDAYVTGNEILPIELRDGKLDVLWDSLPGLSRR